MNKNKHLILAERIDLKSMLDDRLSFSAIASALGKSPSTISREVRSHLQFRRVGGYHLPYNACRHRISCNKSHVCTECHAVKHYTLCRRCSMCNALCPSFEEEICSLLLKPPYVCNGCIRRSTCSLEKRIYDASFADSEYRQVLSESRSGISYTENEILYLDKLISPLVKQGQSPHHICITQADTLPVSERTIYRLIDNRVISAMNLELPRKVRFKSRKIIAHHKVDKSCRIHRSYDDFIAFMSNHPDISIVQMDSVEGKKGGKTLLTIHFVKAELMLAFLRNHNDSKSVIDIFNSLYETLTSDVFCKIFKVLLGDNGTEFSNPKAIEYDSNGNKRTSVFYCDPSAPYQKGSAERNHEFIRLFVPKGADFADFSQDDINLMMCHINSYARESLGDKTPFDTFSFLYGDDILPKLECHKIPPQEVTLNPSIFNKEVM